MAQYINAPTSGSITPLDTVDAVYGMALQYARLLVGGANVKTHYDTFDKEYAQFGAIVADYKVAAVASKAATPNSTTFGSPAYPQIKKRYFGEWHDRVYEVEIRDADAHAVTMGTTSFEVFVAQIINAINEGERLEKNQNYKRTFCADTSEVGITAGSDDRTLVVVDDASHTPVISYGTLYDLNQYETLLDPTDDEVLTEIRDVVMDMTFENGTYSDGYVCGADIRDLRIVVPFKWLNKIGVTTLSRLFNMSEADLLAQIVETDGQHYAGENSTLDVILIVHKNALGRVVRYDSNMETFVRQRFSRWFGREVVDMYYVNPNEKMYAICVSTAR